MESFIKLNVLDIDEGDGLIQMSIIASNGHSTSYYEGYFLADSFRDFATKLISFPTNISNRVIYGGDVERNDHKYRGYLLFEIFCYEAGGQTAIKVIMDLYSSVPYNSSSEFFILTEPASINKLGVSLYHWNPLTQKEFLWVAGE